MSGLIHFFIANLKTTGIYEVIENIYFKRRHDYMRIYRSDTGHVNTKCCADYQENSHSVNLSIMIMFSTVN